MVVPPPGEGTGSWAGAPSACYADGRYYLAYRMRRPTEGGRGYAVVIATSSDGVTFETVKVLQSEAFATSSLGRPALVRGPNGLWRLYMSCATPKNYRWRVDALDAADPALLDPSERVSVLPGDEQMAVKDPVVHWDGDKWLLWACCHPLDDPQATDRMTSRYAESPDGLQWSLGPDCISGRSGSWDARGARITEVVPSGGKWFAYYDGRSSVEENAEERTGIAVGDSPDHFEASGTEPAAMSPWGSGSLRYATVLALADDTQRVYFEACLPDGSHGLFTELV
jgi:hypothetical protein